MRADADFMVYVAARWPSLVKEAVQLGCPPELAAEAATDALSRCRRDWGRASREENVDHLVHEQLVAAAARRPRTDEATRSGAADRLLVLAPPTLEDLTHQQRRNDVAGFRRAARIGLPLAVVAVGAGIYLATSGAETADPPREETVGPAPVERAENPAPGVVWYADGRLHLDHVVLEVEGVTAMTRLGNGVVYGDDEGRVVYAGDDGGRALLGHKDPDAPVAATDETGRAAWVDTGGTVRRLVVFDASSATLVGHVQVDDETTVVAVDGDAVYYLDDTGAHALLPAAGADTIPVTPARLLDVRSRIRAFQVDDTTIQVVQSSFDVAHEVAGRGASLSPDGAIVVTRLPDDDAVAVYDTRSGAALDTGLGRDDQVLAAAPGVRGTITYVVRPGGDAPDDGADDGGDGGGDGGALELRTCDLGEAVCQVVAEIPDSDQMPVLAR